MCEMFTWLPILCCHLVLSLMCVGGETKSPCKSYAGKKRPKEEKIRSPNDAWKGYFKTWDWWNSQRYQGHCPWTPQGGLTAPHMNPPAASANVLTYIGLWSMTIKLNPSWKTEVNKSAWIKPWNVAISWVPSKMFKESKILKE